MSSQAPTIGHNKPPEPLEEFYDELEQARAEYGGRVYDMPAEEKLARSHRHQIGQLVSKVEAAHKTLKAPILEAGRVLDARRNDLRDRFRDLQAPIIEQIEAIEAKRKARDEMLGNCFAALRALAEVPPDGLSSSECEARIEKADQWPEGVDFGELEAAYEDAVCDVTALLNEHRAAALQREAEAAELEELRKAQAAQQAELAAAREAAAKAEREAAEAERQRQESEERAQREREAAQAAETMRKAQEAAEAERAAQAAKDAAEAAARAEREAAEQAERQRLEAEERERLSVERFDEAANTLAYAVNLSAATCIRIIAAIQNGKVKHVTFE